MAYCKELIAAKLRRWEKYLLRFRLPSWEAIPNMGLYMEQVVELLKDYLDYMPPELKDEQVITGAAINNYVRRGILPPPNRRRYYRVHIAYLIMICTLKQSLSLSLIHISVGHQGVFRLCQIRRRAGPRHRAAAAGRALGTWRRIGDGARTAARL